MAYLELTDELTEEGKKSLTIGQVLIFNYEGSPVHIKIMRKLRVNNRIKVWGKRVYLYTPEEADNEVRVEQKQ